MRCPEWRQLEKELTVLISAKIVSETFLSREINAVIYESFKLKCGHDGLIVWRSRDGRSIGVRGTNSRCDVCCVKRKKGLTFTVHTIDVSGETQKRTRIPNGLYRLPEED